MQTSESNMKDLESKTADIMEKAWEDRATMMSEADVEWLKVRVQRQLAEAYESYTEAEEQIRLLNLLLGECCADTI